MKKIFIIFYFLIFVLHANPISKDCTYKGIKLYGEFRIVDYFPDLRVQVVTYSPDLRVQKVNFTPTRCGEWRIVNYLSAKSIQFVDYSPDIRIEWSEFPGLPSQTKSK